MASFILYSFNEDSVTEVIDSTIPPKPESLKMITENIIFLLKLKN